jgi:DNA-binding NarL/FixJ family response regulator
MKTIRILLADDHEMIREGLRSLLKEHADMEVIGEAADGRTAVSLAAMMTPDVAVVDVSMPDLNGIEAARQMSAGGVGVVVLSARADLQATSQAMRAGARAYVPKEDAFDELAVAIRAAASGRTYISPRVDSPDLLAGAGGDAARAGKAAKAAYDDSSAFGRLTAREREVLQLVAEGRATKEAARELGVSVKTVETHRRQMMEKLDLHSVAELTKYALREGLTTLGD